MSSSQLYSIQLQNYNCISLTLLTFDLILLICRTENSILQRESWNKLRQQQGWPECQNTSERPGWSGSTFAKCFSTTKVRPTMFWRVKKLYYWMVMDSWDKLLLIDMFFSDIIYFHNLIKVFNAFKYNFLGGCCNKRLNELLLILHNNVVKYYR